MTYRLTRRKFLANGMRCLGASVLGELAEEAFSGVRPRSSSFAKHDAGSAQIAAGSRLPTDAHGMIVYSEEYITREMPISFFDSWITPTEHFFVRNNEHMPQINPADWKLAITGEVAHPLMLTMEELLKFESRSVTNTLECAGNGRAFFQPHIRGVPWSRGGVGNAEFRGPSLSALLRNADAKATARHVAFRGAALPSSDTPFIRSIPMEKAIDPDTIVATEMNGSPLAPEHGYPARVLVPGWIGSASIKWLTEIRVLTHEFEGYFMNSAYRLPATVSAETEPGTVITSLPIKSIIAAPVDGSIIDPGTSPIRISGAAWAGTSTVARVEVSTDGGKSWQVAAFGSEHARYAWRSWKFDWKPRDAGAYIILSRATDNRGRSQPLEVQWNPGGYVWNAVDRIQVTVAKPGR
jgi:sulfite oxidase